MGSIVRSPVPAKPMHAPDGDEFPSVRNQLDAMLDSLKGAEVIMEDSGRVEGFCAVEVIGKPRQFYVAPIPDDEKGPAMQLWEGEGKPRVIGYLPSED